MLHEFLAQNREELIRRTRAKVAERAAPRATPDELQNGVPLFLSQLVETLRLTSPTSGEMRDSATLHGHDLLLKGFTVAQVVHGYGDVCQAVTALASEMKVPITSEEFQIFNRCLDDVIAGAVTEYARQRDRSISREGNERLGRLAHEMRNQLAIASLSFESIQRGVVGASGSTGTLHRRSLLGMRALVDGSLTEVRLEAGLLFPERVPMAELVEELELIGTMHAHAKALQFAVGPVEPGLVVHADRQTLTSAVTNLLQNAFKFTEGHGHVVSLATRGGGGDTGARVLIDVEDECGGLPPDLRVEELFRPFEQRGPDRSGLGLGLAISQRAVQANGGELHVRNLPGKGCIFTVDLPRQRP